MEIFQNGNNNVILKINKYVEYHNIPNRLYFKRIKAKLLCTNLHTAKSTGNSNVNNRVSINLR